MSEWGDGSWGDGPTATADTTDSVASTLGSRSGNPGTCHNCKQAGHRASDCPEPERPKTCFQCHQTGHMSRECPNGGQNGDFSSGSGGCFKCGQQGHRSFECSNPDTRPPRTCRKCNQPGHMARDCTADQNGADGGDLWSAASNGNATAREDSGNCFICHQSGHKAADCDKPREPSNCRKCHKPGHVVAECTEPNWLDENGNTRPPPSDYRPAELTAEELDEKFYDLTVIPAGENFESHLTTPVSCTGYESEADKPQPMLTFSSLITSTTILNAIEKSNYKTPTPVQQYAIPVILGGRDLMASAQTGSGKTIAFLAPILQKIFAESATDSWDSGYGQDCQKPIALILSPTRELVIQIHTEAFKLTAGSVVKTCAVYGGTSGNYVLNQLNKGCHVLVATSGRLWDMATRGRVSFEKLKYFVLDEADRMIDDGFMPDVRRLITRPDFPAAGLRQTVMFSATFSEEVQRTAKEVLSGNYIFISVGKVGGVNTDVTQEVFEVEGSEKKARLNEIIQSHGQGAERVIIFVQTKKTADFLAAYLSGSGLPTTSIHGDRFQNQREEALRGFKTGATPILVATSVAARGLDIKDVRLVINYDLPENIDDYVHRIGRTGRVGNIGKAISFYDPQHNGQIAEALALALRDSNQNVPEFLLHSAERADVSALDQDLLAAPSGSVDVRVNGAENLEPSTSSCPPSTPAAAAPQAEADPGW